MNETANATLALGALPVMAHAREEVEEMVGIAGALVLNIGTLSPHWVEAMLLAGRAANEHGVPVVLDPVGAGATTYRTETAKRILDEVRVSVLRGNAGEIATLVGVDAEVRGVESIGAAGDAAELARTAGARLGLVASVTGPVDHVSDGDTVVAVANGDPLIASITGTGCMSSALTGCFLAVTASAARRGGRGARRVRRRRRGRSARREGAWLVPRRTLRRARRARSRDTLDGEGAGLVRVHAIVADLETARRAVAAGATVVQLRVKAPTAEVVARGEGFADLGVTFVVNDDVDAAVALGADGVHLGQDDPGAEQARARRADARPLGDDARAGARGGRRLPRRRPDLGDAVEGGRRAAARPRRAARNLRRGACPGGRDRRHRRVERGRLHRRRRGGRGDDPRGGRSEREAGG